MQNGYVINAKIENISSKDQEFVKMYHRISERLNCNINYFHHFSLNHHSLFFTRSLEDCRTIHQFIL